MKKILKGTLTGLLLVTLATPGFAENRQGAFTLSPFVGGYVLDKATPFESRPIFGLRAGYNFTENLGAEAMFGYSLSETKLSQGSAGSKETDLYQYGVDVLYHFMPKSNFVPFVEVGGGVTHFKVPSTPSIGHPYYIGQVNYGAGVKYFVNPDVALRADVRHAILVQDTANNNLEYAVGLTFNFGGKRKAVAAVTSTEAADTVAPKATGLAADTTAPTVTFTSPVKGDKHAPVNQKVNAAFSENVDPNTINAATFTVTQGTTPVSGKVTASASTATFTPARDFEKGKTYTATVTTGARDLAGNGMAHDYQWSFTAYAVPRVVGVLATLENSHFDFNSTAISENGKTILNLNITTLKASPDMKLRIAGYASAAGTEEYNQDLSERRAAAVKEYLVTVGGIDGNRLSTIGYGESSPAKHEVNPSEKLSAEALANMRVVIEIIEE